MTDDARATRAVVDFITRTTWQDVPPDATALAKRCVIDGLAVMLSGSTTHGSAILRDFVRAGGGVEESTVLGAEACRTTAASAALLNGASGHAMD